MSRTPAPALHEVLVSHLVGGAAVVAIRLAAAAPKRGLRPRAWVPGTGPATEALDRERIDWRRYDLEAMRGRGRARHLAACASMLPGLWQLLTSIGIFASARSLPASIKIAAAWYFVAGFAVLVVASVHHTLSPWTMGLPFVIGQFLMAAILHFASGENDGED